MRIQIAVPDKLPEPDRKAAIDAALEAVTLSTVPMVASREVPLASHAIKAGRVRWKPEPPGDEHFDLAPTQLARGWGDCDDLAPWHAASLRATGADPGARAIVVKSGPTRWHAVVKRSDGSIDDPSRAAGMGSKVSGDDVVGGVGPFVRHMQPGKLMVASHPLAGGRWAARADVPALCHDDECLPWLWSSTQAALNPVDAVRGACHGLLRVAGSAYLDDIDHARIAGIYDLLSGVHSEIVDELLGDLTEGEVTLESLRPGVAGIMGSYAVGAYGMGDIDQAFHDAQVFVGMAYPSKPPALYDAIEQVKNLTKAGQFHEAQVLTGQTIPVGNVKAPIRQAVYDAIDLCIQNQPGWLSKAVASVVDTVRSAASGLPGFVEKLATNPRGAIMDAVQEIGNIKLAGIPIGLGNLNWLADKAARMGLGPQLYKSLEALGPNAIPGSPATKMAADLVSKLAVGNPALQRHAEVAKRAGVPSALMSLARNRVPAVPGLFRGIMPPAPSAPFQGMNMPGQTISIPGGPVVVRF